MLIPKQNWWLAKISCVINCISVVFDSQGRVAIFYVQSLAHFEKSRVLETASVSKYCAIIQHIQTVITYTSERTHQGNLTSLKSAQRRLEFTSSSCFIGNQCRSQYVLCQSTFCSLPSVTPRLRGEARFTDSHIKKSLCLIHIRNAYSFVLALQNTSLLAS